MTRLETHQQKQQKINLFSAAIIFVIFCVFMLTVGLKILFSASFFVSNLFARREEKTLVKTDSDDFIATIDITDIPSATNSAIIAVSGSVMNIDTLNFYLNDSKVKTVSVLNQDNFSEEIKDLVKGENEIYLIGKNKQANKQKKSTVFKIIYKSEKPKLEIKEPADNSKVSNQEIKVSGTTEKETFIKVNNLPVVVDAMGNFTTTVRLKDGENKIEITAQDEAQNIESKTLTIIYQKDN